MMNPLHIWAFREILRRPAASLLLGAALASTIAITGTLLVFPRALFHTVDTLLQAAPSIVVRRVDFSGWRPLPVEEALKAAKGVTGVVAAEPRVWGVVTGPSGPLTVVGAPGNGLPRGLGDHVKMFPARGEVVVGAGVAVSGDTATIQIHGAVSRSYRVTGRLPEETSIFTHDLAVLTMADARELMGLPEGYASDLAVDVFHEDEQAAILPDLTAVFPWPVRCTTRGQSAGIYAGGLNRSGTIGALTVIPAVLAVCLLVAVNTRKAMGRQRELGIMKAVGWTTGNIVRLQLYRALFVCLPAAALGVCLSYLMVYWPGATWIGKVFFGWENLPPRLYLVPEGAVTVLLEMAGIILAPVIASALVPAVKGATTDVHHLIEGAGDR